uniref:FAD dependent oxidoreductase domain-containing protein n=1 Tax=Arion vulgaris TaxID=1028688 RepID=A0A0B6ZT11_9EUPU
MVRIGVIGAGAIGLSSAISVQKLVPGAKVTIIADQFGSDTTSSGAGGLFRPYLGHFTGMDEEMVKRWIVDSWTYFNELATSTAAQESGQSLVTGTVFYSTPQDKQYSLLAKLAYDFHQVSPEHLKRLNVNYKFKENGGTTEYRTIADLKDLCGDFDLVINCTGLRAKELLNDSLVYPVRGHLVSIYAPWIKHFYLTEDDIYLIPHDDKLHIGGIREKGNYSLTPDSATREKILRRAEALLPQIKGAKVVGEWVGLRPSRDVIRLESEIISCGTKGKLPVIHNYGHGGHGITLSWGCGLEAAKLAHNLVMTSKAKL